MLLKVSGTIFSKLPPHHIDLSIEYGEIADFLKSNNLMKVEVCATISKSRGLRGGDLSGIGRNSCGYDLYFDQSDQKQLRLALFMNLLCDMSKNPAISILFLEENHELFFLNNENYSKNAILKALKLISSASDLAIDSFFEINFVNEKIIKSDHFEL